MHLQPSSHRSSPTAIGHKESAGAGQHSADRHHPVEEAEEHTMGVVAGSIGGGKGAHRVTQGSRHRLITACHPPLRRTRKILDILAPYPSLPVHGDVQQGYAATTRAAPAEASLREFGQAYRLWTSSAVVALRQGIDRGDRPGHAGWLAGPREAARVRNRARFEKSTFLYTTDLYLAIVYSCKH